MKLPNRKNAIISRRKLINYVLSETQPKAEFFRIIGFTRTNFRYLKKVIYQLAQSEEAKEVADKDSQYHTNKYILEGKINSPSGKIVTVRTIWVVDRGQKRPRFVTIYPV